MQQYDIFLSYVSEDADTMWRVYKDFEIEGLKVWIDQTNLEPGTLAWDIEIEKAIMQAGCLVVILSPYARTATWVREELHYAKTLNKRIFPLLASGDAQNSIPFGFSTAQWTDIRDEAHYRDGLSKLINTICKTLNIESRSQRRARRQAEIKRAEIIERHRRSVEQARKHLDDLQQQHFTMRNEIERTWQEEKSLRRKLEMLAVEAERLQADLKTLETQEEQAHQYFRVANANFEAVLNELNMEDDGSASAEHIRYVDPNHDWSMELPQLAELSSDETMDANAVWHDLEETEITRLAFVPPYQPQNDYVISDRRALPPPSEPVERNTDSQIGKRRRIK